MNQKQRLRKRLRAARRDHVAALDDSTRALLFRRPPSPVLQMVPQGAAIGLYHPLPTEAPTGSYARYFAEAGHQLALPRFGGNGKPMAFHAWDDPWDDSDLAVGPFGALQPGDEAAVVVPNVLFVPLVGFTETGARLGQGGGHYDRWLAANPQAIPIGLGWDVQRTDMLPIEPHDRLMAAIVTPTRLYGPFEGQKS